MAGPQIDVRANTGAATQAIDQVNRAIDNAGRTAERANRKQFRPLAPGALQELREAVRLLERMSTLSGQSGGGVSGGGAPSGGGGPAAPITPPRTIDPTPSIGDGGSRRRGGRWSNYGQNTGWMRFAGAFTGGVGGATSTIASEAMAGSRGAGGGFSGMGLLRGGLLGAGLFGAYKIGSAISEGYENAKAKAIDIDTLKRAMGDLGQSFSALQVAADQSAQGLGINSNEAAKLALEYNRLSGGLEGPADMIKEMRNSVGFGRAYGLDPSQSGQFFASMRFMSKGDEQSSRRLALLIGETISRTGMNARAGELISAIQSFASATNRVSLSAPNVDGYTGAFAGMMGLGIRGMTSDSAMSILSAANQAMMGMGAAGEAGQNFTMAAFNRFGGRLNPVQASILAEGGMFGTRDRAFGPGSAYAKYLESEGIDINSLGIGSGGMTNFEAVRQHLDSLGGGADLKLDAAKRYFGLSSYNQAAALLAMKPQQMGALDRLLGRNGVSIGSVNETGIATLGDIATAGSREDLLRVFQSMRSRNGKGALSDKEVEDLEKLSGGDVEKFRDALVKIAASKDQEETEGSKTRQTLKDIESATTRVGDRLLGPLNDMRAFMIAAAGIGPQSLRDNARQLEKDDVTRTLGRKASLIHEDFMAKAGRSDLSIDERKKLMAARDAELKKLDEERASRFKEIDSRYENEENPEIAAERKRLREQHEAILNGETQRGTVVTPIGKSRLFDKVIKQESGGRHYGSDGQLLTSPAGARGISQIMPKTGVNPGYGVKPLQNETEEEYRRFGNDYLNAMLKEFGGDEAKALAAYNAGPGAVHSAIKKHGANWLSAMPSETRAYVSSVGGVSETPLPAGAPVPQQTDKQVVVVNGEFKLVDQNGRERAAPAAVQTEFKAPRSAGVGAR